MSNTIISPQENERNKWNELFRPHRNDPLNQRGFDTYSPSITSGSMASSAALFEFLVDLSNDMQDLSGQPRRVNISTLKEALEAAGIFNAEKADELFDVYTLPPNLFKIEGDV